MSGEKYTKDHEWVRADGATAAIGISNHAQEQLGDIVFIELPEAGAEVEKGAQVAVIESVKAASEIYAPVAGAVTEVNDKLADEPSLINQSPTGDGWFFKMSLAEPGQLDELMDEAAYSAYLETLD